MSATDELRHLLDERGIEHIDSEDDTTIYYAETGYRYTYNVNPESGWAQLFGYHLTPEQAVAATLGGGECKKLPSLTDAVCIVRRGGMEMHFGYWRCSKCGCENFEGAKHCMNCGRKAVQR